MLLGTKDRAWSRNSDPSNEEGRREFVVFHSVTANQGACATQARLAMNSKYSWVSLTHLQELVYNGVRRCGTIDEEHISVRDSCLRKLGSLVLSLVEAHYVSHSKVLEHLEVILWGVASSVHANLVNRAHEGNKFAGKHPVQVAIFHLFVVLILLVVKFSKVVPAETDGDLKALQTVEDRAAVGAVTVAGITKRPETGLVRGKSFPGDLSWLSENYDHEGAHQKGRISLLVEQVRSVMEQFHIFVALVGEHATQFSDELVSRCEVQWAKV